MKERAFRKSSGSIFNLKIKMGVSAAKLNRSFSGVSGHRLCLLPVCLFRHGERKRICRRPPVFHHIGNQHQACFRASQRKRRLGVARFHLGDAGENLSGPPHTGAGRLYLHRLVYRHFLQRPAGLRRRCGAGHAPFFPLCPLGKNPCC